MLVEDNPILRKELILETPLKQQQELEVLGKLLGFLQTQVRRKDVDMQLPIKELDIHKLMLVLSKHMIEVVLQFDIQDKRTMLMALRKLEPEPEQEVELKWLLKEEEQKQQIQVEDMY